MYFRSKCLFETKSSSKNINIKITNKEKAILESKFRMGEYFMEGENTATIRTANYLYIVDIYNKEDVPEIIVLKKREIK